MHQPPSILEKRCSKCELIKPVTLFNRMSASRDGFASRCKDCSSACNRAYRRANRAELKQKRIQRRQECPEHASEMRKRQYQRKRNQILQSKRAYYQNNRSDILAKHRAWYQGNRERHRVIYHIRESRKRRNGGRYTEAQWLALKAQYGHRCLCCGKGESEAALTVDHVVPLSRGGSSDISNLQPLCKTCNSAKGSKTIDYRTGFKPQQLSLF